MKKIFKRALVFIRDNPVILLSLILVVFLPLSLYFYVAVTLGSFEKAVLNEIEFHANTASDMLVILVGDNFPKDSFENRENLQKAIDGIVANGTELKNIRVIIKEGKDYKAVAAQNHNVVGVPIDSSVELNGESLISYCWIYGKEDVGSEIEIGGKKYRRVIKVFFDQDTGAVYALAAADIPISQSMNALALVVYRGYAIMAGIILMSLLLVFQHTRLFSYVGISKDLQKKNIAKDNFIRMATHELRAPVTVLNAYMESLKDDLGGALDADHQKYVDRMAISVKNLSDLMADILEVSHLEQGRTDFDPEVFAPDAVIQEIVDGLMFKAEEKKLKVTFEKGDFSHKINANLVCFKRIINNLVENSIKYTPAGKVAVSIAAQTAKKRCVIIIQDTGFGISAEGQAHLFEQFYRVKTHENSGIPGTGLGLWMSRQMAQKMGGDIMLESIERMGSKFFVFFPLTDDK